MKNYDDFRPLITALPHAKYLAVDDILSYLIFSWLPTYSGF